MRKISFKVNSREYHLNLSGSETLLEVLRSNLGLTGTKCGCDKGECGACTVIMNGKSVNSCLVFSSQIEGSEIITIEGLSRNNKLHPLQQAFIDFGASQCGFCIPGIIMSAYALLLNNPKPSMDEIKVGLSGNLCRCTGYSKIFQAIKHVVDNGFVS